MLKSWMVGFGGAGLIGGIAWSVLVIWLQGRTQPWDGPGLIERIVRWPIEWLMAGLDSLFGTTGSIAGLVVFPVVVVLCGIIGATIGSTLPLVYSMSRAARQRRKDLGYPGHCSECGYSRRGLTGPCCPECGGRMAGTRQNDAD